MTTIPPILSDEEQAAQEALQTGIIKQPEYAGLLAKIQGDSQELKDLQRLLEHMREKNAQRWQAGTPNLIAAGTTNPTHAQQIEEKHYLVQKVNELQKDLESAEKKAEDALKLKEGAGIIGASYAFLRDGNSKLLNWSARSKTPDTLVGKLAWLIRPSLGVWTGTFWLGFKLADFVTGKKVEKNATNVERMKSLVAGSAKAPDELLRDYKLSQTKLGRTVKNILHHTDTAALKTTAVTAHGTALLSFLGDPDVPRGNINVAAVVASLKDPLLPPFWWAKPGSKGTPAKDAQLDKYITELEAAIAEVAPYKLPMAGHADILLGQKIGNEAAMAIVDGKPAKERAALERVRSLLGDFTAEDSPETSDYIMTSATTGEFFRLRYAIKPQGTVFLLPDGSVAPNTAIAIEKALQHKRRPELQDVVYNGRPAVMTDIEDYFNTTHPYPNITFAVQVDPAAPGAPQDVTGLTLEWTHGIWRGGHTQTFTLPVEEIPALYTATPPPTIDLTSDAFKKLLDMEIEAAKEPMEKEAYLGTTATLLQNELRQNITDRLSPATQASTTIVVTPHHNTAGIPDGLTLEATVGGTTIASHFLQDTDIPLDMSPVLAGTASDPLFDLADFEAVAEQFARDVEGRFSTNAYFAAHGGGEAEMQLYTDLSTHPRLQHGGNIFNYNTGTTNMDWTLTEYLGIRVSGWTDQPLPASLLTYTRDAAGDITGVETDGMVQQMMLELAPLEKKIEGLAKEVYTHLKTNTHLGMIRGIPTVHFDAANKVYLLHLTHSSGETIEIPLQEPLVAATCVPTPLPPVWTLNSAALHDEVRNRLSLKTEASTLLPALKADLAAPHSPPLLRGATQDFQLRENGTQRPQLLWSMKQYKGMVIKEWKDVPVTLEASMISNHPTTNMVSGLNNGGRLYDKMQETLESLRETIAEVHTQLLEDVHAEEIKRGHTASALTISAATLTATDTYEVPLAGALTAPEPLDITLTWNATDNTWKADLRKTVQSIVNKLHPTP